MSIQSVFTVSFGLPVFEWDDRKNAANIKKHGIAFDDISSMFEGPLLTAPDIRQDYGEDRWTAIGLLCDIPVVIAYTERLDRIRIISARKAKRHEAERFFKAIQK